VTLHYEMLSDFSVTYRCLSIAGFRFAGVKELDGSSGTSVKNPTKTPALTPALIPAPASSPALAADVFECDDEELSLKAPTENKLAEKGGVMRFSEVCTKNGQSIDLVITTDDEPYRIKGRSYNSWNQFGDDRLGAIGMRGKAAGVPELKPSPVFKFSFYKSGTTDAVKVKSFYMSFYNWYIGVSSQLTFQDYSSYTVDKDNWLQITDKKDGEMVVTLVRSAMTTCGSVTTCGKGTGPKGSGLKPYKPISKRSVVTLHYEMLSDFSVTYRCLSIAGFRFAGVKELDGSSGTTVKNPTKMPAPTPAPTTPAPTPSPTRGCRICALNLGGGGTTTLSSKVSQLVSLPSGQRVKFLKACKLGSETADLVMTTKSSWSTKPSKNSIVGDMYRMVVQGNTSVEFEFKLVRTGTTSPILAEEVVLSILDVDAEMVESMHSYRMMCAVSAKGYSAQVHGDAIRKLNDNFYGAADGSCGNPSSSFGLPPKQKAQGVALKYKDVSQWTIVFTIYNKGVSTAGRGFFLTGSSDLMGNSKCSP